MEQSCRLCADTNPTLSSISALRLHSSELEDFISLSDLIQQYLSISINALASDPMICGGCFKQLEDWHLFRENCQQNERKFYKPIKFEEVITGDAPYFAYSVDSSATMKTESNIEETDEYGEVGKDDKYYPELDSPSDETNSACKLRNTLSHTIEKSNDQANKKRRRLRKHAEVGKPLSSKRTRGRPKHAKDENVLAQNKQLDAKDGKPRVRPKICTICGMARTDMSAHMRWHNNERPYNCPYCPKIFLNSSNLKNHINLHTREKMYKCDLCDKEFPSTTGRSKHRETHTTESVHLCATCGKSFKFRASLARHKQIHFDEPKEKCTMCDMLFLTKSRLRKHFLVHLDVKPFSCDICRRAFNRKDNLKTHMKTHTDKTGKPQEGNDTANY